MTRIRRSTPPPIFCQHCNADIEVKAIKACLRKTCEHKDKKL